VYHTGISIDTLITIALISLLTIVVRSDLSYMVIPNSILLIFAGLFVGLRLLQPLLPWWHGFVASGLVFVGMTIISVLSRGGMGGGDVKLFAVVAWILGIKLALLAVFLSACIGVGMGLIGIGIKKVQVGKPMPFAPAIALGVMCSWWFGDGIITTYMQLF
jgi:leader peptidase (prepilin peptidase)/N-methyltransferase